MARLLVLVGGDTSYETQIRSERYLWPLLQQSLGTGTVQYANTLRSNMAKVVSFPWQYAAEAQRNNDRGNGLGLRRDVEKTTEKRAKASDCFSYSFCLEEA